jgi:hypothetical protein
VELSVSPVTCQTEGVIHSEVISGELLTQLKHHRLRHHLPEDSAQVQHRKLPGSTARPVILYQLLGLSYLLKTQGFWDNRHPSGFEAVSMHRFHGKFRILQKT